MRKVMFVTSLIVAVAGFAGPLMFPQNGFYIAVRASFLLAGIWTLIVIMGLIRYRLTALWLMLGAPLAFYWPVSIFVAVAVCSSGGCL
jgi:hypothetical protein